MKKHASNDPEVNGRLGVRVVRAQKVDYATSSYTQHKRGGWPRCP